METKALRALLAAVALCSLSVVAAAVWAADDVPLEPGAALTLNTAIGLALRYHPARLAAESEAGAARERIGEAQAFLLPQVFGGAQYLRGTDNGIGDSSYVPMV